MKKPSSKWHAISIVVQESSCATAAMCRNKRFLSAQVPMLPMRDCDRAAQCACKFKHYDDRRAGVRRTGDLHNDLKTQLLEQNRRSKPGRRTVDSR
jgi:hypothetical protein